MTTKRELLGSELIKEIVSIRIDTLWNMLGLRQSGRLPAVDAEKATGEFDDKGALFIPGGFVLHDWEENPIRKKPYSSSGAAAFRRRIRKAMRHDGAHLLYPDGMATRVTLGNTAYAKIAVQILQNRKEALRRRSNLGDHRPGRISSADISRSYCPTYIPAPYGTRTSLGSEISVCLTEPRMYFQHCETYFNLRGKEADRYWSGIKESAQPILGQDGVVLAPPFMVTCHSTRYREEILTGITRISGFGKFGEFATFTLERCTGDLLRELADGRTQYPEDEIVADHEGMRVAGVLRIYPRTNPGARLKKGVVTTLVAPARDLGIDIRAITAHARERYRVS